MFNQAKPMTDGERKERAARNRRWLILSLPFAAGLALGGYIGSIKFKGLLDKSTDWPPAVSIGLAVAFVIGVLIGGRLHRKQADEVEIQNSYKGAAVAGTAYFTVYPVWFLLWKGGLVPEPMHFVLFLGFWGLLIACYLYYRYR